MEDIEFKVADALIGAQDALIIKLRQLLLDLYVSGSLWIDHEAGEEAAAGEIDRLYDTVLAAGEGRTFEPLGLPFPRTK